MYFLIYVGNFFILLCSSIEYVLPTSLISKQHLLNVNNRVPGYVLYPIKTTVKGFKHANWFEIFF